MSIRNQIAHMLSTFNSASLLRLLEQNDCLRILAYHRIVDVIDEVSYPFDVELISASTQEFSWQMEYIKANFSPITFAQLIAHLSNEQTLPPRPLIVTFDDGFSDNFYNAYPILKKYSIPATFFVSTGYIGTSGTFWFDEIAYAINSTKKDYLEIEGIENRFVLSTMLERQKTHFHIVEFMKTIPNNQRLALHDKILSTLDVAQVNNDSRSSVLNWDQIKEMSINGMEFGSHTVTHPVLSRLSDESIDDEIGTSKRTIEDRLQMPCQVISYPVGGIEDFDQRATAAARSHGYTFGASYKSALNHQVNVNQFDLKRIHIERYTTRHAFQLKQFFPNTFY